MSGKRVVTEREKARAFALADRPADAAMLRLVWDAGLTAAETAALTWGEIADGTLETAGRRIPLEPEAAEALEALRAGQTRSMGRPPEGGEPVFPSAGRRAAPVTRMTVSRRIRDLLDRAGLREVHPKELKELYILRQLERRPVEEVSRLTGFETRTLRDIWAEYGREEPLRGADRDGSAVSGALEDALSREDGCLDARVVRLSWQGGLTVQEMRALRWSEIPEDASFWSPRGTPVPVPEPLRPWLARWRERDLREGKRWPVEGERSGHPGEPAFLTRRAGAFLIRHGLEEISLARLRGRGVPPAAGAREALLALARKRGRFRLVSAARRLKLPGSDAALLAEALRREGLLESEGRGVWRLTGGATSRERFESALEARRGGRVTVEELRRDCGLRDSRLFYYIKEAAAAGRLVREGRGVYRVSP